MFKTVTFCVFAMFAQSITCNCIRTLSPGMVGTGVIDPYGSALAYGADYASPWYEAGYGLNLATLAASNRCGLTVTSSSPAAPNGVSILSENMVIEGPLAVNGQLPFLGTLGLEGTLPADGMGVVSYGCGNGNVGITNEAIPGAEYALASPYGMAPTMPGVGMGVTGMYGGCRGIY